MPEQLLCNTVIDYSALPGSTLPFTVALNLADSILSPGPGVYQKFCYTVTGVGTGDPGQYDLSHWVLEVCDEITVDQIVVESISVVIDDVPQIVEFGVNVVLQTDPTTGCMGIKFDFPLSKLGGVMDVCFSLNVSYPIGPSPVCLKGATEVASGLNICGPSCGEEPPCDTYTYQTATVCAPVVVTPSAVPGTTRLLCCGSPIVVPGEMSCASGSRSCHFTVSQKVCIEVPITFSASAAVGDALITCGDVSPDGCSDCN